MRVARAVSILTAACALLAGCQNRADEQRLKDLEARVSTLERRAAATAVGASSATGSASARPEQLAPAGMPIVAAASSAIAPIAPISGPPAQDPASAEPVLVAHCKKEWPIDFRMQAYCQNQQREAVTKLNQPFPADLPAEVRVVIRDQCAQQWPDDYRMREYCEGQQTDGYRTAKR